MLDPSGNAEIKKELEECKRHLHQMMQQDLDLTCVTVRCVSQQRCVVTCGLCYVFGEGGG